jgi:hypothetical protein
VSSSWLCGISDKLVNEKGEDRLFIDMDLPVLQVFFAGANKIKVIVHRALQIILFTTKGERSGVKVSKKIRGEKPGLHDLQ